MRLARPGDILPGMVDFQAFPKIPRLNRDIIVSEKIDGTNACVVVADDLSTVTAQSRTRIITPEADNYGFAAWVAAHADELRELGPGHHFGEWWGAGIQRRYDLTERRFSLFNSFRWAKARPACCDVVPVLGYGTGFDRVDGFVAALRAGGSVAAPGFMNPEGVVVYHTQSGTMFKVLLEGDASHKGGTSE